MSGFLLFCSTDRLSVKCDHLQMQRAAMPFCEAASVYGHLPSEGGQSRKIAMEPLEPAR